METTSKQLPAANAADFTAGTVVFFAALPLCLGVASVSGAPPVAGILAGIVGGILIGLLSGSQTSVSGPSAAIATTIASLIAQLGTFEAFLLAAIVAGLIQVVLGLVRAGVIANFFPSSVIQGLIAAIGVVLVLKQIPHVLGRDTDPEGEMSFQQPDRETTFSEFGELLGGIDPGAAAIGVISILLVAFWGRIPQLNRSRIPVPLIVVATGMLMAQLFRQIGGNWAIADVHMVQVPLANNLADYLQFFHHPDFSQWSNPNIYVAGLTISLVTSLETTVNIQAIDKVDRQHRITPPNRELLAQGIGNVLLGLIGGIPISSVVVRSAVNIDAGAKTCLSTIVHGLLMLVAFVVFPSLLNRIPLSCLAAILLMTGFKLVNQRLIRRMWNAGYSQFIPFVATLLAILLTDLVTGILIGMALSIGFILNSSLRSLRPNLQRHLGGDVTHIVLGNQVTFLNRPNLEMILRELPTGSQVLLDAEATNYIDPDVLSLIRDFKDRVSIDRGVQVSVRGFQDKYQLQDDIRFVDHSTRQLQESLTWKQVLRILKEGNNRFLSGEQLTRDLSRQLHATAKAQSPMAVVLSCIDSRTPAELVFDLGIGDIFGVRMAGHVVDAKVLGSLEYACSVAGSKLILVMGHTRCGAVTSAVNLCGTGQSATEATGCQNLDPIIHDIQLAIEPSIRSLLKQATPEQKTSIIETVAIRNVELCVQKILVDSQTICRMVNEGRIAVVGAIFDINTGKINFLEEEAGVIAS